MTIYNTITHFTDSYVPPNKVRCWSPNRSLRCVQVLIFLVALCYPTTGQTILFGDRKAVDLVEQRMIQLSLMVLLVTLLLCNLVERVVAWDLARNLRSLISSNCIMIERGSMPPYQKCEGCIIEDAIECLTMMRSNATGSISADCDMNMIYNRHSDYDHPVIYDSLYKVYRIYDPVTGEYVEDTRDPANIEPDPCCPAFVPEFTDDGLPRLNDDVLSDHMGYITTFECLIKAGCEGSEYYVDLKRECDYLCPESVIVYPVEGGNVCRPPLSAAPKRFGSLASPLVLSILAAGFTTVGLFV